MGIKRLNLVLESTTRNMKVKDMVDGVTYLVDLTSDKEVDLENIIKAEKDTQGCFAKAVKFGDNLIIERGLYEDADIRCNVIGIDALGIGRTDEAITLNIKGLKEELENYKSDISRASKIASEYIEESADDRETWITDSCYGTPGLYAKCLEILNDIEEISILDCLAIEEGSTRAWEEISDSGEDTAVKFDDDAYSAYCSDELKERLVEIWGETEGEE